ncbi:MAG: hypothetical protein A2505_08050 [Deltaproteobacteria bacterium RIFOXYD12_FULL_55_16]|nr:MAG: hypothetical protein A2505_08050 [Deltaproteobacteria bacterium RIFOXYD12_FULL_55_16]
MTEFLGQIVDFFNSTNVPQQLREIDARGLFTNPWFLAPFIAFIFYNLYKQALNTLVMTSLGFGLWFFSGSSYMEGLVVNGFLQLDKVLPVAGVFIGALAIAVYFLFMRSD